MELGHLFTRSGLTRHHVPFMVFPRFFFLFVCISFLSSVIYYEAFCSYVATSFLCIPVFCLNLGLYFVLLQSLSLSLFFLIISPSVSCCFSHIFHICCCYSSCVSCFNGPIFTSVLQSWRG